MTEGPVIPGTTIHPSSLSMWDAHSMGSTYGSRLVVGNNARVVTDVSSGLGSQELCLEHPNCLGSIVCHPGTHQ